MVTIIETARNIVRGCGGGETLKFRKKEVIYLKGALSWCRIVNALWKKRCIR